MKEGRTSGPLSKLPVVPQCYMPAPLFTACLS
jgi:hypothetical protein